MTIHIPENLMRGLERAAALQQKSAEEVALESLRSLFEEPDSPAMLLRTLRALPHPSAEAIDDLDAAIESARLAVRDQNIFEGRSHE